MHEKDVLPPNASSDSLLGIAILLALDTFLKIIAPIGCFTLLALHFTVYHLPRWLLIWMTLESLFYLHFLQRRRRLLRDEPPMIAPTDRERQRLFERVIESFGDREDARSFVQGWFHWKTGRRWDGHGQEVALDDLCADNVNELLAAAFFNTSLEDVRGHLEHNKMLCQFLNEVEGALEHRFRPGYDERIQCIRQMLEAVPIEHRPACFYVATLTASMGVSALLGAAGFERHTLIAPLVEASKRGRKRREGQAFEYFVHRGLSRVPSFLQLLRKQFLGPPAVHTSPRLPIVISAGLGGLTGIFHAALYLLLVTDRPIFLVGLPAVSLRLKEVGTRPRSASDVSVTDAEGDEESLWEPIGSRHKGVRATVPSLDLQTRGLRMMLDRHGSFSAAVFVSHSLGTGLMSFAARRDPSLVAANILVDPITFLIWHSRLVKVFLYKQAKTIGERFIRLFSREFGIVSVVSRAFFWHQVASFVRPPESALPYQHDTVNPLKTHVILSSEDALVSSKQIADYLKRGNIRYTMLDGIHHAGFLMAPHPFLRVMRIIVTEADNADKRTSPLLIQRPSFTRTSSSSISGMRRFGSGPLAISPTLSMTSMTMESQPMVRRTSRTSNMVLPPARRRSSSILGGSLAMTATT